MNGETTVVDPEINLDLAIGITEALSVAIGPRPPGSPEEALAADLIRAELELLGLDPVVEEFPSAQSFGASYLVLFGMALAAGVIERRSRLVGAIVGVTAGALGLAEARFIQRSPLSLLKTIRSQNVHAVLEPDGEIEQTVCIVSHMDSSRSGLMFHPSVTPHLGNAVASVSLAVLLQALAPLLSQLPGARTVLTLARVLVLCGAGLVLEREVRGHDVPGANDNASGVGACLALTKHFSEEPLEHTRLVVLVTGSEESGVFGMRDFLAGHDTDAWMFINFDGVGADAPLRVLSKEGGPLSRLKADAGLLAAAAAVGEGSPDLAAAPLPDGSGLPYDATPVIAAGGRAITIVNQDGAIPNYHWPTDTVDHVSRPAFRRALSFAALLVRRLDRV